MPSVGAFHSAGVPRAMFAVAGMPFAVCGFEYYVFFATGITVILGVPRMFHYAVVALLSPAPCWGIIV